MAPRFRIAAGLGPLLVLLAASFAAAAGPAPAGARVAIVGGTSAQRHLARLTALRVGGVTLSRITFRAPTPILRHMHVHGIELVVSSRGKDTVRSEWEQELYVGAYLGLMARAARDSGGQLVWATSQLPGTGAVFTIPRLDSCSPVHHSEMVGRQPPPCPAK